MIDGSNARGYGVACAWFAGAVHANAGAGAVRFCDGSRELGFGVLVRHSEDALHQIVATALVDFGEVGALLVLFAHGGDDLVRGVGAVGVGEEMFFGVKSGKVLMTAVNVDGIAADAHPRAGDEAAIDGIADGDIGAARAFGAHVALRSEAGKEVGFGSRCGAQNPLRDGFLNSLVGLVSGMEEEVCMGIDETRHEGGLAEVEDLGVGRVGDMGPGLDDAFTLDEDLARRNQAGIADVEKVGGVENDGGPGDCRGLLGDYGRGDAERQGSDKGQQLHMDVLRIARAVLCVRDRRNASVLRPAWGARRGTAGRRCRGCSFAR